MVSDLGTWVQLATVGTLVTAATGKAAAAGLVAAATFGSQGIGAPLGGVLADRFDRRHLFLTTLGIQTIVTALLAVAIAGGQRNPNVLALFIVLQSGAGSMGSPALQSILPELVPPQEILAASSLGLMGWNIGRIVGPLIAALLAVVGPSWAIGANAISFLALWFGIASLRRPFRPSAVSRGSIIGDLVDGARGLWHARGCVFAVGTSVWLHLLIIPFMGFAPVFARRLLGVSVTDDRAQRATSVLLSAQGVGAVIGGLLVTTVAVRFGRAHGVQFALIASCILVTAYVHAPGLLVALVFVGLLGGTVAMVQSMLIATNQQYAPRENRGRILSWWQGLVGLSYGTGLWLHGRLGDSVGLRTSLTVGAGLVFISGGIVSIMRPRWRHLIDAAHLANI